MDTAYLCCNHVVLCITFAEFQIYMDLCAWDLSVEENTTAKNEIIGFIVNASKRKRNSNFLTHSLAHSTRTKSVCFRCAGPLLCSELEILSCTQRWANSHCSLSLRTSMNNST